MTEVQKYKKSAESQLQQIATEIVAEIEEEKYITEMRERFYLSPGVEKCMRERYRNPEKWDAEYEERHKQQAEVMSRWHHRRGEIRLARVPAYKRADGTDW